VCHKGLWGVDIAAQRIHKRGGKDAVVVSPNGGVTLSDVEKCNRGERRKWRQRAVGKKGSGKSDTKWGTRAGKECIGSAKSFQEKWGGTVGRGKDLRSLGEERGETGAVGSRSRACLVTRGGPPKIKKTPTFKDLKVVGNRWRSFSAVRVKSFKNRKKEEK